MEKSTTNFRELLPRQVLFNLKDVQQLGILKIDMAKKLIYKGELEVVKIGNKLHLSYSELLRYLEKNTIPTIN
ncbi:DNA-binding protein [Sulfurimonas sp.]|uniref:DNA-binding protein n=1 Tax=Sulfurimonas sp. TaxID=2022749 RepID=UPI0025D0DD2D|nr:DNA-binding protein [Sulfurimonas sp.]MDD5158108.1 DNA-binding protein [Sulfurimonas sp.]